MLDVSIARLRATPIVFLRSLAFINYLGYAGWAALLYNFTVERANFQWFETGLTQSVREIPGFLAFTAIFWLLVVREQVLAYVALAVMGLGVALTGQFPSLGGVLITTFLMSVGFHYFETMNVSLQLQLLPKAEAPRLIGTITAAGAAAQFASYGGLAIAWWAGGRNYQQLFLAVGIACITLTAAATLWFQRFEGPVPQRKRIVLRQRYWLYYTLTFMTGARRQLFVAFGGFLLVKKFGYNVADMASLMLVTTAANTLLAPRLGRLVMRVGERHTIMLENVVLIVVFAGYATTASATLAGLLFVIDGVFFTLTLAQRTYFQKIADPADLASTTSVAFTINHVAAVVVPVGFGTLGMIDPAIIFWLGAGVASVSLTCSFLVPRHPAPGRETVLIGERPLPAE
ncbi:MAG TPA: MFS transporter [Hyphomicrobiaceae bacterium]|nr:MFS transporter [Hyphomicrobiaceae bacterium]